MEIKVNYLDNLRQEAKQQAKRHPAPTIKKPHIRRRWHTSPNRKPWNHTQRQVVFLITINTGIRATNTSGAIPSSVRNPGNDAASTNADANNTRTSEHSVLRLLSLLKLFNRKSPTIILHRLRWCPRRNPWAPCQVWRWRHHVFQRQRLHLS